MEKKRASIDVVRASRAGHTFHERWAARRALQLVFPKDDLYAIAVEGISTTEAVDLGAAAADIADLILYYGTGDTFETCTLLETLQFKHVAASEVVTASYLQKTILKFCDTIVAYEKKFPKDRVAEKLSFGFVTNADFSENLWTAIRALKEGVQPKETLAKAQYDYLAELCGRKNIAPQRIFSITDFRTLTEHLDVQNKKLRRTLCNWSAGVDPEGRVRLHGLSELVREKAQLAGQENNLIRREDVLDVLGCWPAPIWWPGTNLMHGRLCGHG